MNRKTLGKTPAAIAAINSGAAARIDRRSNSITAPRDRATALRARAARKRPWKLGYY